MRGLSEVPIEGHSKEWNLVYEFNLFAEKLKFQVRIINLSTITENYCLCFGSGDLETPYYGPSFNFVKRFL